MSTTNRQDRRTITKLVLGAAIVLGAGLAGAAPAGADPNATNTDPNPYGTLGCNCHETAPAGSPELSEKINRGMHEGMTVSIPGLPAPARSGQPSPR